MELFDKTKFGRLIPVKLVGNQLIKINDPNFEKKYNQRLKTSTKHLEKSFSTNSLKSISSNTTVSTINTNTNTKKNSDINNEKLIANLSQKYEKLIDGLKNGTEIIGTVEEKKDSYSTKNPFLFKTNLDHHNFISNTKKVLFKKGNKNVHVLKILDNDLYLTIFNKTQPPKRVYNKEEVRKIKKIQKRYRGYDVREVSHPVLRLKVNYCVLETFCLLVARSYDSALRRKMFYVIKEKYHDLFIFEKEIYFEDKLEFKLPDRYYNMENIQKIDIQKKNKIIKEYKKAHKKKENKGNKENKK